MPWIDVCASEELPPGGRCTVEFADGDVVVWRSVAGRIAACEARCPHQWAHLGSAGVVDGEVLVCLSHGWCFELDGEGFKESATGRRDVKAPVATVSVREVDDRVEIDVDRPALGIAHHRP